MTNFPYKATLAACLILGAAACNRSEPEPTAEIETPPPPPVETEMRASDLMDIVLPPVTEWTMTEGASVTEVEMDVEGVDGPIYKITLTAEGAQVYGMDRDIPISAGDTVSATVTAWTDADGTEGRMRIVRHCGGGPNEQAIIYRNLTTIPARHEFSHVFEHDQACARLQFDSRQPEATFYVSGIELVKQ